MRLPVAKLPRLTGLQIVCGLLLLRLAWSSLAQPSSLLPQIRQGTGLIAQLTWNLGVQRWIGEVLIEHYHSGAA